MAERVAPASMRPEGLVEHEDAASPAARAGQVLLRARFVYRYPGGLAGAAGPGEGGGLHLQVDFSLTERRTVLFGPSGAGKSTVLRVLAGLLQPSEGLVTLRTQTLVDTAHGIVLPPGRRGIGYLTQEPALFPHLSVEGNIGYGLHGLPRVACRARVSALMALFSLEPLAGRLPLRLSGGERQRVALARALASDPSLLLLDEPFTGLDATLQASTIAALDRYLAAHETRETMVMSVSHDVAEVYASGAEVLLLEAGRIIARGPGQRVLAPHRERLLQQLGASAAEA